MNQIQAMRVFTRVAETQSFRRAAQQLDVSNALVTRSIAMLEAHLNTRLINRTTRNVSLTEAGHRYLQGCRRLLEELEFVEATVTNDDEEPRGTLRVAASAALSDGLTALLDAFRRRYPRIKLHLTLTELPVDVIGEGYDAAIVHGGMAPASGIAGRMLSANTPVVVASPDYLLTHPAPQTPEELSQLPFVATSQAAHSNAWRLRDAHGVERQLTLEPVYTVNSTPMLRAAALAGMGVAILPEQVVEHDIALGRLVRLLANYAIDDGQATVSVIYPNRQYMATKTRAFVEFALAHYDDYRRDGRSRHASAAADASGDARFTGLAQPPHDAPPPHEAHQAALAAIGETQGAQDTRAAHTGANGARAARANAPWPSSGGKWLVG